MDPTDQGRRGDLIARRLARAAPGLASLLHYDRSWLRSDLLAGVSVAAVALPVGIAYAALAGVPAVYGIYAAIFPLLAYALFGSLRQIIIGPDSATCVLVAATLMPLAAGDPQRYLALMVILSLITGVFLMVAGVLKLGFIANFLSQPILTGFLNGIALVIIVGQFKTLFGYSGNARGFIAKLIEFAGGVGRAHLPSLALGLALLLVLVLLRRLFPRLPSMLVVMVLGIALVAGLDLEQQGIAVLGSVPAGLPAFSPALPTVAEVRSLLAGGVSVALVAFISGILTVKSFARRQRYEVDADRELFGLGACNIVSGLAQGFAVTGSTSRTAVNIASGGKSQLAGCVAAITMLLVLLFLTGPLGYLPDAALAAVILITGVGLLDLAGMKELYATSRIEFGVSMVAMLGVLILGVLPGVGLAVTLSLGWLLYVDSRPPDAVLGRIPGVRGYHNLKYHPEALGIPGLLIYQFSASIVFYNADFLKRRVRQAIRASVTPVEWVVVDASPVNYVDVTGMQKIDELREELAVQGTRLVVANVKTHILRHFGRDWVRDLEHRLSTHRFPTIKAAVKAFQEFKARRPGPEPGAAES